MIWHAPFPNDLYTAFFGVCFVIFIGMNLAMSAAIPSYYNFLVLYAIISAVLCSALYLGIIYVFSRIAHAKFVLIHWVPSSLVLSEQSGWYISNFRSRSVLLRILSGKAELDEVMRCQTESKRIHGALISPWVSVRALSVRPADSKTIQRGQRLLRSGKLQTCIWLSVSSNRSTGEGRDESLGVVIYGEPSNLYKCPSTDKGHGLVRFLRTASLPIDCDDNYIVYSNVYERTYLVS